ncbi:helix-turn-helix domain-containing protein [Vibrio fluminensis]|uniref:helix-turn-helix domain-containing protein n=1 Tax=Vibrio fluminensis TaxID=2783614 RepID=UPI0018898F2C|nr:helix-turn-helix transcriptional regulator [Vibrio fluminensis]
MDKIHLSSSNNLLPFINYFTRYDLDWRKVALQHAIPEDIQTNTYWLPSDQCISFIASMVQLSKRKIGIEVGHLINIKQISPELDTALSQCHNLEQALHELNDLMPTLNNHVMLWVSKIDDRWFLCHRSAFPPTTRGYEQAEWFRSLALISLCKTFLGNHWLPKNIKMRSPAHLSRQLVSSFQQSNLSFDHEYGAIEIELAEEFIAIEMADNEPKWLEKIEQLMDTYAALPHLTLEWFCPLIGTSTRTFQRKLNQHQTSFKALRDNARYQRARKCLESGTTPFETAWRCGFNDLSNFNRAFKSWSHVTPAQYKKSKTKR